MGAARDVDSINHSRSKALKMVIWFDILAPLAASLNRGAPRADDVRESANRFQSGFHTGKLGKVEAIGDYNGDSSGLDGRLVRRVICLA